MKQSSAFFLTLFQNPNMFKEGILNYLASNGIKVSRSKTIAKQVLYAQKETGAVSSLNFFTGSIVDSETNIDGNYIRPEDEAFIITQIRVLEGTVTGNNVDQTDWSYGTGDNLNKNLQMTVTNNGVTVLRNVPGTAFNPDLTTDEQGFYNLPEPILWQGQSKLNVQVDWPANKAATDGIRIELHGIGLIS